jgi:hypothetical protein
VSEAQGRRREARSERSVEQTREPFQQQQRAEAAHLAESFVALQTKDPRADATDTRNQSGTNAEGTDGLLKGLEELLRLLSDTLAAENSGPMDTPSSAFHDLETMETRHSAVREAAAARGQ